MIQRLSAHVLRGFRVRPGSWAREGEWLVARWPIEYGKRRVYELETAIAIDAEVPAEPPSNDAALAAILLAAMRRGRALRLPGPVDATLKAHLPRVQALYASYFPDFELRPVPVHAPGRRTAQATGSHPGRIGVFTSLGVDSFFSLLANREVIQDLILVRGFDIGNEPVHDALWDQAVGAGRAVAEAMGMRLVPVRTNLRLFLWERRVPWGIAHGAVLAHVAMLLQPWLRTVYLASSFDINHISPWGSTPDLDPLWSTDTLQIVHDGVERNRLQKILELADSPLVLEHLRVCIASPNGVYNCGRCRKCIPTMLALQVAGVLERCATFPHEVTQLDLGAVIDWGIGGRLFLAEIRDWWRENDPEHELLPLTETILTREDPRRE